MTKPERKWVRSLLKLGFCLLTLVFLASMGRLWINNKTHKRMATIRKATLERVAETEKRHAAAQPMPPAIAPIEPPGTPVGELPYFGKLCSNDEAIMGSVRAEKQSLIVLFSILSEAESKNGQFDFVKLLYLMGIPMQEGLTQAQAAAEWLMQSSKFASMVDRLMADAKKGPWSWKDTADSNRIYEGVGVLLHFAKFIQAQGLAYMATSCSEESFQKLEYLRLLSDRLHDGKSLFSHGSFRSLNRLADQAFAEGLNSGLWTELELTARAQQQSTALLKMRATLEGEKDRVTEHFVDTDEYREKLLEFAARNSMDKSVALGKQIRVALLSDQQIEDQRLLQLSMIDFENNTIGLDGSYNPPQQGTLNPVQELTQDADILTYLYFDPNYLALSATSIYHSFVSDAVKAESNQDLHQISAGLELYRRKNGSYPPTLDALGPLLGQGLPADPATGQPYSYQPTDSGFKVWGTGPDQQDNQGDAKQDVVREFTRP